ncbi:MAG: hypothetical protein AAF358_21795 [Pseudomonadota bacterium]
MADRCRVLLGLLAIIAALFVTPQWALGQPFVNWENHPVHALDLSPDGTTLAVAHTADARVQLFDVSTGLPVFAGSVLVGLDPVSVRFRTDSELWVVNHISDSLSIIDVAQRRVRLTVDTADEPYDVVFAGPERAFVTASQVNQLQVFSAANPQQAPQTLQLAAEDPRTLAVSPDGQTVYAAIFESGNGTTLVAGATQRGDFPPNAALDTAGPYGGTNPPPNEGQGFSPALNVGLSAAPQVGQIVRRTSDGRWLDDNNGDWTDLVSGPLADRSGRISGWDLPDRDIAVIDAQNLTVSYVSRLMNIGMAISVNPATGAVVMVGTDGRNEVRFEPNVNGTFLRVQSARVSGANATVNDLNPHLDYLTPSVAQAERARSLGDPRGVTWLADGSLGFVAGMGSNNVVLLASDGQRLAGSEPIEVGEGPVGLAVAADQRRLFVWNHFSAELSVVDIAARRELTRLAVHNPLPPAIRDGRRHFYDTHATSGLGHASCASCHVDGRADRLAWDLGDPGGETKMFNQNCSTSRIARPCDNFHPLKGPMVTQTLQDIIGKEPLHWRGDRDGIEEFNPAFVGLMGADAPLSESEMAQFKAFLGTLTFPPNPYRQLNNNLSSSVDLTGHVTSGRFAPAGQALGSGNAIRGRTLFDSRDLVDVSQIGGNSTGCRTCHTVPTGLGSNGRVSDPFDSTPLGGRTFETGPNDENHLHVSGTGTLTDGTFKIPHLRNMHEKTGMDLRSAEGRAGFGFVHDGSVDSLANFLSLEEFLPGSDQDVADLVAFLLSFSGSGLGNDNTGHEGDVPLSLDTHAGVGHQTTLAGGPDGSDTLVALAESEPELELIVSASQTSWLFENGSFTPDDGTAAISKAQLRGLAASDNPLQFTLVPAGSGNRLALDRDLDGILNGVELNQGSNPADAASTSFRPAQGLWFNPDRSGHGVDIQLAGNQVAGTWYTYTDDGIPIWYQGVGTLEERSFTADLLSYRRDADGTVTGTSVGTMTFDFSDPTHAEFSWTVDGRPGRESFERFVFSNDRTLRQFTGLWFDPAEPGYGLTIDTLGDVRVVVAYFYDANNEPRWTIGQASNDLVGDTDMLSFTGFCPDCELVETRSEAGGSLTLSFAELERQTELTLSVAYPGLAGSSFEREAVLVPLTDVPLNLEH